MKTQIKLTNPTDDELSAAVATHVAKWKWLPLMSDPLGMWVSPNGTHYQAKQLPFATSADAVLPLLEKYGPYLSAELTGAGWIVTISNYECKNVSALDRVFARAGSIALLRANGIEVEVTP